MTDQQPELHRFGKRILMLEQSLAAGVTQIWRDVTLQVAIASSKYRPHQGAQERARRLRQAARRTG